eukprot:792326-Prymnesium_polylepis.1
MLRARKKPGSTLSPQLSVSNDGATCEHSHSFNMLCARGVLQIRQANSWREVLTFDLARASRPLSLPRMLIRSHKYSPRSFGGKTIGHSGHAERII